MVWLAQTRSLPKDYFTGYTGIPTRVRKTTVRTTPVRSQQCECQQCERVNSANANSANATAVRMPAVRMRQQCERRFSELCKTVPSVETTWSRFLTSVFCPSLPIFYTQEIDDWRPKFRLSFRLWWPLIDWLLSTAFGEGARKHWENNQCEESNSQRRNGQVRTLGNIAFVFSRPALAFTASPFIAWQVARDRWHLLEKTRLRFNRRKRIVPSKARAPQCLHSQVMFIIRECFFLEDEELCCWIFQSVKKKKKMRFALLAFALLSHFFRTDVASHCWHSHCWHSHSCLIRTVDPFALLAFALLASHWCRSHFCLSHSCRTSTRYHRNSIISWIGITRGWIQSRGSCDSIHSRWTLARFYMQRWLFFFTPTKSTKI